MQSKSNGVEDIGVSSKHNILSGFIVKKRNSPWCFSSLPISSSKCEFNELADAEEGEEEIKEEEELEMEMEEEELEAESSRFCACLLSLACAFSFFSMPIAVSTPQTADEMNHTRPGSHSM